jgi:hypothetical protein
MGIKVRKGDVIRSYDFKPMVGRPDCYVEGTVVDANNTEQGYDAYKITVTLDHFGDQVSNEANENCRVARTVFVPKEVMFNDYPGRVINLSCI